MGRKRANCQQTATLPGGIKDSQPLSFELPRRRGLGGGVLWRRGRARAATASTKQNLIKRGPLSWVAGSIVNVFTN